MPTRNDYAKIHIAKKDRGLTDEQYRDVLYLNFKKRSSTELSDRQVVTLLDLLDWKPKKGKKSRSMATDRQSKKIRAMWITLHKMGVVRNPSEKALASYVKRMTGVDYLRWANEGQKSRVIESLKAWIEREECGA